jgi:hypothetical protein
MNSATPKLDGFPRRRASVRVESEQKQGRIIRHTLHSVNQKKAEAIRSGLFPKSLARRRFSVYGMTSAPGRPGWAQVFSWPPVLLWLSDSDHFRWFGKGGTTDMNTDARSLSSYPS